MVNQLTVKRPVLCVVMDGVGVRVGDFGNAVELAYTPNLDELKRISLYRTLKAHGTAVGLPSDEDMGNSEVGHNALGAGRIYDQGAKLADEALEAGTVFRGECWRDMMSQLKKNHGTLHFIGLLSDGNVHSHEKHLYKLLEAAKRDGIHRVRVHTLLDGRDVGAKSAEKYVARLEDVMKQLRSVGFDIEVASGGGRMVVTMDRYEADWQIVARGWAAHVDGKAPHSFRSLPEAIQYFRQDSALTDQMLPPFVIVDEHGQPNGTIEDGDAVVLFNFRGDRAIEISRAFTEPELAKFPRTKFPKVFFAGMMEYDGDLHIPPRYLVAPPHIVDSLGEYLAAAGVRQFACSETQKFGHVTYFWNGNRTGKFNELSEEYVEIKSDNISFDLKPWMKAYEIMEATVSRIQAESFDFGRINFANGDMVGHTGNLEAAVIAVETVDLMLGHLIRACREKGVVLVVTADHGNADEMFETTKTTDKDWLQKPASTHPKPKTSHTLNPVPFYVYDPKNPKGWRLTQVDGGLGNVANTVLVLMGLDERAIYLPSLVEKA